MRTPGARASSPSGRVPSRVPGQARQLKPRKRKRRSGRVRRFVILSGDAHARPLLRVRLGFTRCGRSRMGRSPNRQRRGHRSGHPRGPCDVGTTGGRALRSRLGVAALHAALDSESLPRRRSGPRARACGAAHHPSGLAALVGARERTWGHARDRRSHRTSRRLLRELLLVGHLPAVRRAGATRQDATIRPSSR